MQEQKAPVSNEDLVPRQYWRVGFGQAKSDIENGTEQGPLECAPVSEASLNDETVMKSGSRFSHGGSTKQEQTASTYQGRKGNQPPSLTSLVTESPQKRGNRIQNGHKARQVSGSHQVTDSRVRRTRTGQAIKAHSTSCILISIARNWN